MRRRGRWPGRQACSFGVFLSALPVVLDVLLARPGDSKGVVRDVFGDRRVGPSVSAIPDGDGSDQGRVDGGLCAFSDPGAVLLAAVVVGGDRAGPEVRVLAHV